MTNQDTIITTVLQAKCTLICWGDTFIKREKSGDDITCCTMKLTLLAKWIDILEDFLCQFYNSGVDDPFVCLTEEEAMEFVGKVKIYIKQ